MRLTEKVFLVIFVLCIATGSASSQSYTDTTSVDTSRVKHTVLPIVFYLPESGFGFGATAITTFRFKEESPLTRPSQVLYSAAYTLKNQVLVFVPFELYHNQEKNRLQGELGFYKYFYNFYGIGDTTSASSLENYDVVFPRADVLYSRLVAKNLYLGGGFRFDYFNITSIEEKGILATQKPIGWDGGTKFNLQANIRYDGRDNIFSASKGVLVDANLLRSISGDFSYWRADLAMSHYLQLPWEVVWANDVQASHASSGTPFFDLPYVSTPRIARGFSDRRYMNYNLYSVQTELRFPVWKNFKGASFVSASELPTDFFGLAESETHVAYGIGLRYELDTENKTRLRLDVARASEGFNFYLTVNEAF